MASIAHGERRIVEFAAATRVGVSLLALLTMQIVTPYDTSTHLVAGSRSPLTALANWDGVYFAQIARNGYDYEHVHAFFPLYPMLVRVLSYVLAPLVGSTAIVVSGWVISNVSFVLAAKWLYRLSHHVLLDEAVARRAAYLFCIAPSSIFMTAMYSESLMCALSFRGMLALERHARSRHFYDLVLSAVAFGAASATRSNGALLSLYIAWHRVRTSPRPLTAPRAFLTFWIVTALLGVVAIGPQFAYFIDAMRTYCPSLVGSFARTASSTLLVADRPWCADAIPNVSAMYVFIQREYWHVGLFQYYEWKQLPNFVLAAPMIALSAWSLLAFGRRFRGLSPAQRNVQSPYYAHWLFLLVNALLVVHIQVTTRLLSACPPLFWAPAAFFVQGDNSRKERVSLRGRLVVAYFLLYTVLGSVLFPSFYPWT